MSNKKIIGLNAVAKSGKDEIGRYLVEKHGFTRVGLADPVRQALYNLNPIVHHDSVGYMRVAELVDNYGWDKAKESIEVRELLQRMGTEAGRNIHGEDCWLKIAERKINDSDKIVITDVRFDNEAEFVQSQSADAYVFHVFRPGVTSLNDHASEVLIPTEMTNGAIHNDGSIEELHESVDKLIEEYNI